MSKYDEWFAAQPSSAKPLNDPLRSPEAEKLLGPRATESWYLREQLKKLEGEVERLQLKQSADRAELEVLRASRAQLEGEVEQLREENKRLTHRLAIRPLREASRPISRKFTEAPPPPPTITGGTGDPGIKKQLTLLPGLKPDVLARVKAADVELRETLGRAPRRKELAAKAQLSLSRLGDYLRHINENDR